MVRRGCAALSKPVEYSSPVPSAFLQKKTKGGNYFRQSMVVPASNPNTREMEAGKAQVQGEHGRLQLCPLNCSSHRRSKCRHNSTENNQTEFTEDVRKHPTFSSQCSQSGTISIKQHGSITFNFSLLSLKKVSLLFTHLLQIQLDTPHYNRTAHCFNVPYAVLSIFSLIPFSNNKAEFTAILKYFNF